MKTNKPLLFAATLLILTFVVFPVTAHENGDPEHQAEHDRLKDRVIPVTTHENIDQLKEVRDEMKENRQENVEKRCDLVETRVNNHVTNAKANKERHVNFYNNVKSKISEYLSTVESKGIDTTELKAELSTMDTLVKDLSEKYDTYISKLEASKSYDCGNSDGKFVIAIQEVRSALLDVRKSAQAIRTHYVENIKPLIKEIRSQLKTSSEE